MDINIYTLIIKKLIVINNQVMFIGYVIFETLIKKKQFQLNVNEKFYVFIFLGGVYLSNPTTWKLLKPDYFHFSLKLIFQNHNFILFKKNLKPYFLFLVADNQTNSYIFE